jgi:site-specific DNA-methyltransferase (adenine-specific)
MKPIAKNTLFYGDNLDILRDYIPDESVDLIYLDPPFNSNRSYNVLFKDESGKDSQSQITAFEDTWHWGQETEDTYRDLVQNAQSNVSTMISALREFIGANQMMAYLVMMTARLIELHRVLKPTGSIYLHCDPTASHYLKIVMDTIFGFENFQNEINWRRKYGRTGPIKRFGTACDVILFYTRSDKFTFYNQYGESDPDYIEEKFRHFDENGRRYRIDNLASPNPRPNLMYEYKGYKPPAKGWAISREKMEQWDKEGKLHFPKTPDGRIQRKSYLDELKGEEIQSLWDDILPIGAHAQERLGYPTQKPVALLERIIQASSNEGDLVLDPFCGCGTAIVAAHKLKRRWIGIDVTHLSISLMKYRLKDSFNLVEKKDYDVIGEPESIDGAHQLARDDRYQFQWWALSLIQAKPLGADGNSREGKKGSDKGIDGMINFINEKNKTEQVLIQVKSGHVKSGDIRDLRGAVEREGAAIGVFITLEEPSKDMVTEAASSGHYRSNLWQQNYPRIQILTIEELLDGRTIDMPKSIPGQFKQAEKIKKDDGTQGTLDI